MMIELEKIKEHLANSLSPKRFLHSQGTAETAARLAKIYNEDSNRAYIAGLVHDCTRELDMQRQHDMLKALALELDELTLSIKELIHAHTAEYVIRNEFEIYDVPVINAVKFHTTGRECMTLLEKIVFLSDVTEPSRSFPGVEYIRQLSETNLEEAMLAAFDSSIRFLLGKRSFIHPNTFLARDDVLRRLKEKEMG